MKKSTEFENKQNSEAKHKITKQIKKKRCASKGWAVCS